MKLVLDYNKVNNFLKFPHDGKEFGSKENSFNRMLNAKT